MTIEYFQRQICLELISHFCCTLETSFPRFGLKCWKREPSQRKRSARWSKMLNCKMNTSFAGFVCVYSIDSIVWAKFNYNTFLDIQVLIGLFPFSFLQSPLHRLSRHCPNLSDLKSLHIRSLCMKSLYIYKISLYNFPRLSRHCKEGITNSPPSLSAGISSNFFIFILFICWHIWYSIYQTL